MVTPSLAAIWASWTHSASFSCARAEIAGCDPLDHGIDVARVVETDLLEHREGGLDRVASAIAVGLVAALLGEETRPVLIEDNQMAGEEFPILLRLEELLLAEPNDLGRRVEHLLALDGTIRRRSASWHCQPVTSGAM